MSEKLIQSYVKSKFLVSTIYRQSSACINSPPWYYETMVWAWDAEKRDRGEWLYQGNGAYGEEAGLRCHMEICRQLALTGKYVEEDKP